MTSALTWGRGEDDLSQSYWTDASTFGNLRAALDPNEARALEALAGRDPDDVAVRVELGDAAVIVARDADGGVRARLDGDDGDAVPVTPVYWFAWSNFYPNTKVVE